MAFKNPDEPFTRITVHEAKEMIENLEDEGEISEDEARRALEELQKLTDQHIQEIERHLSKKEQEILEG